MIFTQNRQYNPIIPHDIPIASHYIPLNTSFTSHSTQNYSPMISPCQLALLNMHLSSVT